jgi:transposase
MGSGEVVAMFLKQSPNKETGRNFLSIVKKVRNPETGKSSDALVESLGYLDTFLGQYPDPVAHFREVARRMTEQENERRRSALPIDMDEELPVNSDSRKNLGYAAILKIYHELELDRFLNNKARHQGFEYNTNSIMTLLVVSRILSPGSKLKAFREKGRYFERFGFALHDMYRALSHFSAVATDAQRHINERVAAIYGRDTSVVYYDVTNFYFETDKEDELRKRGFSKEKRHDPIVQMGLAMDASGIPLHYELFAGNTVDKGTFRSVIGEVRRNYDTGRIIVVADMGIITGDNIFYLVGGEKREKALNGYVLSFSIRGGTDDFKAYVLDHAGYHDGKGEPLGEDPVFMLKSRRIAREINVTMASGKTAKKTVYEKQVVFWSKKYADKARADRGAVLKKAMALIKEPSKFTKATAYGAAKYVKNIAFDKKTKEVVDAGKALSFDYAKVMEEEKYDGYYSIVTSELGMSDKEIVDTYRGLWEIEETFRITKGTLEARPFYVSLKERIDAHVLTCFIALVILRLLQKQTGRRFSCDQIVDCLNRISCSNEQENLYLFNYRSDVSDAIGSALGIDFTKKRMRLNEIKNLVAKSKK